MTDLPLLISTPDIEALKRIAEAATSGPWVVWSSLYEGMAAAVVHDVEPLETVAEFRAYRNAVFLATFDPPTVLALLSELAALRSERDEANGPGMLRALREVEAWLEVVQTDSDCPLSRIGAEAQLIDVRAAITKAQGDRR